MVTNVTIITVICLVITLRKTRDKQTTNNNNIFWWFAIHIDVCVCVEVFFFEYVEWVAKCELISIQYCNTLFDATIFVFVIEMDKVFQKKKRIITPERYHDGCAAKIFPQFFCFVFVFVIKNTELNVNKNAFYNDE